jgi:hypothetical protein
MEEYRNKLYNKNEMTWRPGKILEKMEYRVFEVEIGFIANTKN